MTEKDKEKIDNLFKELKQKKQNLTLTINYPTAIRIMLGEKKEFAYSVDDFVFTDPKAIELLMEVLNVLLLGEKKEYEKIKEKIKKIKIEFPEQKKEGAN